MWNHKREDELLEKIEQTLERIADRQLSFIKLKFGGSMPGPVTITVGQATKATVAGFDQFGAPWTGVIPPVTYSIDNATLDSSTPEADGLTDDIVSLAAGTANLTASVTNASGVILTDTESITNVAQAPVLSSIKISFSTPQ